jgi:acyl-CoA thioester hydrolase
MSTRYTRRFRVRHYELDGLGHLNNVVYVNYMQEAAIEASAALGFGADWYRAHDVAWVVRRLTVRYHAQVTYGDEIDVVTWVSKMRGVRSYREYDLKLVRTGARVARGRAEWVYIDRKTNQPTRYPEAWTTIFTAASEVEELGVRMTNPLITEAPHRYVTRRRVQFHELDPLQHVNHAAYLHWIGEAHFDAIRAAGYPLERCRQEGWLIVQAGHDVEFFAPAVANDNIEIVSWVCEMGKVRGAWTHEISNADTGKLLICDYSLGAFVDLQGKPTVLPSEAADAILRGPTK